MYVLNDLDNRSVLLLYENVIFLQRNLKENDSRKIAFGTKSLRVTDSNRNYANQINNTLNPRLLAVKGNASCSLQMWWAYQSCLCGFFNSVEHGSEFRQPVTVHSCHTLHVFLFNRRTNAQCSARHWIKRINICEYMAAIYLDWGSKIK